MRSIRSAGPCLAWALLLASCSALTNWDFEGEDGGRDVLDGGPGIDGGRDGGDGSTSMVQRTLTIVLSGDGRGRVTSATPSLSCEGTQDETCTVMVADGAAVSLDAMALDGASFGGWSGACSGTARCELTVSGDVTIGAAFDLSRLSLNVTREGDGVGTVSSDPPGIACGDDCSESFDRDAEIELTAMADGCSEFAGWSGDCNGTGACVVTMSRARAVTATFERRRYTLSISLTGSGSGSVRSDPAGIDCGSMCAADFACGEAVDLEAVLPAGSELTAWSGACGGAGACSVDMTMDRTVTARFEPCGRYGGVCCGTGAQCTEGACLGNRCVTYGGSFHSGQVGNALHGNAFSCPPGFVQQRLEDGDFSVDEGTGELATVFVCVAANDVATADFRGGYGEVLSVAGCGATCEPNRLTGACSCASGATRTTFRSVHYQSGTTADCERNLSFCGGTGAPLTFGGAFHVMDAAPTDFFCQNVAAAERCEPNRVTGNCSCPAGFAQARYRMLESRNSGGQPGFCRGDLVVCQRPPP